MMKSFCFILFGTLLAVVSSRANNLQIVNVSLTGQNTTSNFTMVKFDVSWENSWRDNSNWDAAWLFVKWSTDNGYTWRHASLSPTAGNHTAPSGSTITPAVDSTGVFLYRSSSGSGTAAWTNVQLRWEYGNDGVDDFAIILVKVFGIEMVYVRQGAFNIGDGATTDLKSQFEDGTTGNPKLITGEGALTLGGGGAGSVGNNNKAGSSYPDDFDDVTSVLLPAAFPKGYNAFYCMKYEATQEQYKDFLNTLTRGQQQNRVYTSIFNTAITLRYVMSSTTVVNNRNGIRCDATIPAAPWPVKFYCDFNGNGVGDEAGDGQNIPANYIIAQDLTAYADWSGLRPMSELEYEKACRGPIYPISHEYAWGGIDTLSVLSVTNAGMGTEASATTGANWNNRVSGPVRAGMFATAATNREESGSSYWGIMELSGNLMERTYGVGNSNTRIFDGQHGNGELTTTGNSDVSTWSTYDTRRGGAAEGALTTLARISDRAYAGGFYFSNRWSQLGIRCVRTAP
jgi:formylglycine-generating enzyme required for sulfatase activity